MIKRNDLTEEEWKWYVEGCAEEVFKVLHGTDRMDVRTMRMMFNQSIPLVRGKLNAS